MAPKGTYHGGALHEPLAASLEGLVGEEGVGRGIGELLDLHWPMPFVQVGGVSEPNLFSSDIFIG